MRYRRAVEKLRTLADACQRLSLPADEPLLLAAYVYGELLDGTDPLDWVEVALVVDLPLVDVPWESQPRGTEWIVHTLRLDKGGFSWVWRSRHGPVWNHHVRGPVRFWSLDGADEDVFQALAERRLDDLPRLSGGPDEAERQARAELASALAHLRDVRQNYWERDWRSEHRGNYRYPENELWEAVAGYLDLLDVAEATGSPSRPAGGGSGAPRPPLASPGPSE
jgi:hypothetical protein